MSNETIGKSVRSWRTAAGMTQGEAAKAIGISQVTLSHIEKGKRPMRVVEALNLAKVVGVDLNTLVSVSPMEAVRST